MLSLCGALLEFVDSLPLDGYEAPPKFELSVGIHTTAAQVRAM